MNHSFNIDIAKEYGIEEAIILENMYFWLEKNRVNGKHLIDNQIWTYNSQSALAELFPYMNRSKIQRVMAKLEESNLINRANYNVAKYDKTTWYALTPLGYSLFNINNGLCKMDNGLFNLNNGISQNEQPIPYINPTINTDINHISKKEKKETDFDILIKEYTTNEDLKTNIYEFIKMRKAKKAVLTTRALKLMLNKLNGLAADDETKNKILDNTIMNGWSGVFALKEDKGNGTNKQYNNKSKEYRQSTGLDEGIGFSVNDL